MRGTQAGDSSMNHWFVVVLARLRRRAHERWQGFGDLTPEIRSGPVKSDAVLVSAQPEFLCPNSEVEPFDPLKNLGQLCPHKSWTSV